MLQRVATHLGLKCYPHDYYCIDAVFYEPADVVPGTPAGSTWLRALSIAFEHENNVRSGLYQEASHLLIMDADLRVLVTYPLGDGIEDLELESVRSLIDGSRHAQRISDEESFLLILGSEPFDWEGFVYKTNGWLRLRGPNSAPPATPSVTAVAQSPAIPSP